MACLESYQETLLSQTSGFVQRFPRECIDYVLLHELCHIAEHIHSKNFYRLMKQVIPHWEKVKEWLDGMAYFYLNDV